MWLISNGNHWVKHSECPIMKQQAATRDLMRCVTKVIPPRACDTKSDIWSIQWALSRSVTQRHPASKVTECSLILMDTRLHRVAREANWGSKKPARAQKRQCRSRRLHFQMLFWGLDDIIVARNVITIHDLYVEWRVFRKVKKKTATRGEITSQIPIFCCICLCPALPVSADWLCLHTAFHFFPQLHVRLHIEASLNFPLALTPSTAVLIFSKHGSKSSRRRRLHIFFLLGTKIYMGIIFPQ